MGGANRSILPMYPIKEHLREHIERTTGVFSEDFMKAIHPFGKDLVPDMQANQMQILY